MKLFRIIPATIITAALLLCVKVVGMVRDTEMLFITPVEAQQGEKQSNVSAEKPNVAPDQDKAAKKPEDKKAEDSKKDEKKTEEKSPEKTIEKTAESTGEAKPEEKKEKSNPAVSKELESSTERRYTAVEVELLQSLSKRREELDRWENNIQIKESALEAAQKRIDDKIEQIEDMKKQVSELLEKYNTQEDAKIKSLVKIYENMKPADAARIFDEVEMPILLLVIDSMAEKKASPILAAMNPKKAKQLTVELANQRKLNTAKISGADTLAPTPASAPAPQNSANTQVLEKK
jgi:flagellar motility protein MotE (MotC chaperone)